MVQEPPTKEDLIQIIREGILKISEDRWPQEMITICGSRPEILYPLLRRMRQTFLDAAMCFGKAAHTDDQPHSSEDLQVDDDDDEDRSSLSTNSSVENMLSSTSSTSQFLKFLNVLLAKFPERSRKVAQALLDFIYPLGSGSDSEIARNASSLTGTLVDTASCPEDDSLPPSVEVSLGSPTASLMLMHIRTFTNISTF